MGISYKVVVAVGTDKSSRGALKWCLRTMVNKGETLPLIHVHPPVQFIPTPLGRFPIDQVDKEIVSAYKREIRLKIDKKLECFKQDCASYKVQPEILLVEHSSVKKALLEKVSELGISKLIVGTSSPSLSFSLFKVCRKLRSQGISAHLCKQAPPFCAVLAIRRGRLYSVKDATSRINASPLWGINTAPSEDVLSSHHIEAKVRVVDVQENTKCNTVDTHLDLKGTPLDFKAITHVDSEPSSRIEISDHSNFSRLSFSQNHHSHKISGHDTLQTSSAGYRRSRSQSCSIKSVDVDDPTPRWRHSSKPKFSENISSNLLLRSHFRRKAHRRSSFHIKSAKNRFKKGQSSEKESSILDASELDIGKSKEFSWLNDFSKAQLEAGNSFRFDDDEDDVVLNPIAPVRVQEFRDMVDPQFSPYKSSFMSLEDGLSKLTLGSKFLPDPPESEAESYTRPSTAMSIDHYNPTTTGQQSQEGNNSAFDHKYSNKHVKKKRYDVPKVQRVTDNRAQRKEDDLAALRSAQKTPLRCNTPRWKSMH